MSDRPVDRTIFVFGAGAIGCFVGGHWQKALAASGIRLELFGRDYIIDSLRQSGLTLNGDGQTTIPPEDLTVTSDIRDLRYADAVILSTKATALDRVIIELETYVPPGTPIISLLNGVTPVKLLRQRLPDYPVIAGMVPFNVVWLADNYLHRSSAGQIALARTPLTQRIAKMVRYSGVSVQLHDDLEPLQYGKLLLNLINPINALSGLPLHQMLSQRPFRKIYAAVLREALRVYADAQIDWSKAGPFSPSISALLLRLPDAVFNRFILRLQKIDRSTMTSMASDLAIGRKTEIATINGEIVRLAARTRRSAPINSALVDLIHHAEQNGLEPYSARDLARELGLG